MKRYGVLLSLFAAIILVSGSLMFAHRSHIRIEPAQLNHLVLTVDQATYDAVLSSTFLSDEFANGGVQTVVAGSDESWTGRYVVGENLYLEIFGPGGREGREPGYVGLAFSTVNTGDINSIHDQLRKLEGDRAYRLYRNGTDLTLVPTGVEI